MPPGSSKDDDVGGRVDRHRFSPSLDILGPLGQRGPLDRGPLDRARSKALSDLGHHGVFIGEFTRVQLGIHLGSIDCQLEATAARRFELQALELLFVLGQDFCRQTDGAWLVVSSRAVSQVNFHDLAPYWLVVRISWSREENEKTNAFEAYFLARGAFFLADFLAAAGFFAEAFAAVLRLADLEPPNA